MDRLSTLTEWARRIDPEKTVKPIQSVLAMTDKILADEIKREKEIADFDKVLWPLVGLSIWHQTVIATCKFKYLDLP
jgi:hypothetical protein